MELAKKAHQGQVRGTGEQYIEHPLRVALKLSQLGLDVDSVVAALLHDVVEDTPVNLEQIKKMFGQNVAKLVDGVTKLGQIRLKRSWFGFRILKQKEKPRLESQLETFRKLILATAKNIQVLIIKLYDRLDNMNTIEGMTQDKRTYFAQETLDLYAPLAYRLGIGEVKGELEDLAFQQIMPEQFASLKIKVKDAFQKRRADVKKNKHKILVLLAQQQIRVIDIHGRTKHWYSLWRKLKRLDGDLNKIYDLIALRVIVPTVADCYKTLQAIHSRWSAVEGRIKDYIAQPKKNGYQSLHTTILGPSNRRFEVQIRTPHMHDQAEFGVAAHWHYDQHKLIKDKIKPITSQHSQWLERLATWRQKIKDQNQLATALNFEIYSDRVFVFTPKGDIRDLPSGATPIDFAYTIHTSIGDATIAAKVNRKMVKLDHKLQNGDTVEIIFNPKHGQPHYKWLGFVKTALARSRIRRALRLRTRLGSVVRRFRPKRTA